MQPTTTANIQKTKNKYSFLLGIFIAGAICGCNLVWGSNIPSPDPSVETQIPAASEIAIESSTAPDRGIQELDFLAKPASDTLRVMSYNINWDSIFPEGDPKNHEFRTADRVDSFRRIIRAVQPDIICFQEINPRRDPNQVADMVEEILNQGDPGAWQAVKGRDSVVVTHFDLVQDAYELNLPAFPPELIQAGGLINLPNSAFGHEDLYLICNHFKSGGSSNDISMRQRQADAIVGFLGDAMTAGGEIDLPKGTGIVILGDLNVYDTDPAHHLATLLTGDIDNEERYGPDIHPDWDETDLADALPSHNNLGEEDYTWRDDTSSFAPGILDRILFTDSNLELKNAFVLDTTLLSEEALMAAGLQAEDVLLDPTAGYFDHLPLIVDLRPIQ